MALSSPLAYDQQIWKGRQRSNGFGVFNDDFRDAIKGDVNSYGKGYIQGIFHNKHAIETGIRGSIDNGNGLGFADDASETINYFNCHDNLIIYDKLAISLDDTSDINSYIKLAFGIIMLSFGKPFIYEGNEFKKKKKNDANSYRSPLYVNAIDWADKENNKEIFTYTKNLISLRKSVEAFKYTDYKEIEKRLKFIEGLDDCLIGYSLDKKYLVLINANGHEMFVGHDKLTNHLGIEKFNKIEKIFDKEGINNINIDISHGINLESLSVNVYKIGDAYGL